MGIDNMRDLSQDANRGVKNRHKFQEEAGHCLDVGRGWLRLDTRSSREWETTHI